MIRVGKDRSLPHGLEEKPVGGNPQGQDQGQARQVGQGRNPPGDEGKQEKARRKEEEP